MRRWHVVSVKGKNGFCLPSAWMFNCIPPVNVVLHQLNAHPQAGGPVVMEMQTPAVLDWCAEPNQAESNQHMHMEKHHMLIAYNCDLVLLFSCPPSGLKSLPAALKKVSWIFLENKPSFLLYFMSHYCITFLKPFAKQIFLKKGAVYIQVLCLTWVHCTLLPSHIVQWYC